MFCRVRMRFSDLGRGCRNGGGDGVGEFGAAASSGKGAQHGRPEAHMLTKVVRHHDTF